MSSLPFSSLALHSALLSNLELLEYHHMTEIQAQALPAILQGQDVIGQAKTGSGKTAAFALGMLNKLEVKRFCIQALVLCPTRELAEQVAEEIRLLARQIPNVKVLTLCGGVPVGPQKDSLQRGAHIIVGTPGRVLDHLEKERLDLRFVETLVLDEADRMLDMGFQIELDNIIDALPQRRQNLLFSATFPDGISSLASRVLREPVSVKVEEKHDSKSIRQHFYRLEQDLDRQYATELLLLEHQPVSSVVFCTTRKETQAIADALHHRGFSVIALHGDMEQREREQALLRFANNSISVLVATDVAARGIDIESLDMVINFRLAHDTDTHLHRIGRTGRAGKSGMACTLYTDTEYEKIAALEEVLGEKIRSEKLPSEACLTNKPPRPAYVTLRIGGGKRDKLRPGDILGALTANPEITGNDIGKIKVTDKDAFVAVRSSLGKTALHTLETGKLKGRTFRAWFVR